MRHLPSYSTFKHGSGKDVLSKVDPPPSVERSNFPSGPDIPVSHKHAQFWSRIFSATQYCPELNAHNRILTVYSATCQQKTPAMQHVKPENTISSLDGEHSSLFKQALARLLATEVAENTYAEILDGLPTIESFNQFHYRQQTHPVLELEHRNLCPGVIQRTRAFKAQFSPYQLAFPQSLLAAFQQTHSGTQRFELRLIELLAVACHRIAVYLYNINEGEHKHAVYEEWRDQPHPWAGPDDYIAPTPFFHGSYVDFDQYPDGIADVVGYWAEAKIFGGVVVFDRGPSGTECRDVFLHPADKDGPRTLFPPTPEQYNRLIAFLLGPPPKKTEDGNDPDSPPLPIIATSANRWRYDPSESMTLFNIFRDRHERKPSRARQGREHCHHAALDWPELADYDLLTRFNDGEIPMQDFDRAAIEAAIDGLRRITPSSPLWPSCQDPGPP